MADYSAIGSAAVTTMGNILAGDASARKHRQFIREQNDYNKPVNQLKRLREAGISPVSEFAGNMLSSSNQEQPADAPDYGNLGSVMAQGAQLSLLNAQRENIQADTAGKQKKNDYQDLMNRTYMDIFDSKMKTEEVLRRAQEQGIILSKQQLENLRTEQDKAVQEIEVIKRNIKSLDIEIAMKELEKANLPKMLEMKLKELGSNIKVNEARSNQLYADARYLIANANNIDVKTEIDKLAKKFAEDTYNDRVYTVTYEKDKAAAEKNDAQNRAFMSENELELQQEAQSMNLLMAPISAYFSALSGGFSSILRSTAIAR